MASCVLHNFAVGDELVFNNKEVVDEQPETEASSSRDPQSKDGAFYRDKLLLSLTEL